MGLLISYVLRTLSLSPPPEIKKNSLPFVRTKEFHLMNAFFFFFFFGELSALLQLARVVTIRVRKWAATLVIWAGKTELLTRFH